MADAVQIGSADAQAVIETMRRRNQEGWQATCLEAQEVSALQEYGTRFPSPIASRAGGER